VENIGSADAEADVEIIYMALDIIKRVELKEHYLYISYPSIIRRMVAGLGLYGPRQKELLDAVRRGGDVSETVESMAAEPEKGRELNAFLRPPEDVSEYSANYLENLKHSLTRETYEQIGPDLENFISICRRLDSLECRYIVDFSLLGDLEYYTGVKFQFLSAPFRRSKKDILCSGGRYDKLISTMWELEEQIPAVGFALFARNMFPSIPAVLDKLQNICIYIRNITRGNVEKGQRLCDQLSELGFCARISFAGVKPEQYDDFGLVIEVDLEAYDDGYQVLSSQKIGKPLLKNLFGESNGR
jgi:ATP phosphoribosyltransferase regulatory subunit